MSSRIRDQYSTPKTEIVVSPEQLGSISWWNILYAVLAALFGALAQFAPSLFVLLFSIFPDWIALAITPEAISGIFIAIATFFAGRAKAKREDAKVVEATIKRLSN